MVCLSCVPAGEGCFDVVLSDTAFYPTGGGQPCDLGELDGFPVEDVRKESDLAPIVHRVRAPHVLRGTVRGRVDAARRLAREGRAVVMVLHDLRLALRHADALAVLADGALTACGSPEEVYSSGAIDAAFGVALGRVHTDNGWQYYYE